MTIGNFFLYKIRIVNILNTCYIPCHILYSKDIHQQLKTENDQETFK